jgi:alcohol dehydrogenase class IV
MIKKAQKEYIGVGSIYRCKGILREKSIRKVLLVTGKGSYEKSGAKYHLEKVLKGYKVYRYSNFSNNPNVKDIERGISLFRRFTFDLVIAVGGGSVIDTAKLLNFFIPNNQNPRQFVKNKTMKLYKNNPLIAVPTTSGSGSESTHFAVLYIDKIKQSIAHETILPDISIVDPKLTYSLPSKSTAISGMDALSQAIESYWSVNSNNLSKSYARKAIQVILRNLEGAVNTPSKETRYNMSLAAHLAGKAINITKTTAPHAVSYPLTVFFKIPHGHAVALTIGSFCTYNYEVTEKDINDGRGYKYVRKAIGEIIKIFGLNNIYDVKKKIRLLMKNIGLETRLEKLGIDAEEKVNKVVRNINPQRMKNNPRDISSPRLKKMLNSISSD